MKMKRMLALLLAAAMIFSLAACSFTGFSFPAFCTSVHIL